MKIELFMVAGMVIGVSTGTVNAQKSIKSTPVIVDIGKVILFDTLPVYHNNFPQTVKVGLNKNVQRFNNNHRNTTNRRTQVDNWIISEDTGSIVSNLKFVTLSVGAAYTWNAEAYFTKQGNQIFVQVKNLAITKSSYMRIGVTVAYIPVETAAKYFFFRGHINRAKKYINKSFRLWEQQ